jgi:hypothetical protein
LAFSQQIGSNPATTEVTEQDEFAFADLSSPASPVGVPEPSSLFLLTAALGSMPLLLRARCKSS